MSIFDRLFGRKPTDLPSDMPWDRHPSIYEHVAAHRNPDGPGLTAAGYQLPDEERVHQEGKIRFAPGAWDGIMTHHGGWETEENIVSAAAEVVRAYCQQPTAANKLAFYESLLDGSTLGVIDSVLQILLEDAAVNHQRLYEVAYSFTTEAIDREPVKFGIAILGLYNVPVNEDLFQTLGRHDEFTLYCAVTLTHSSANAEQALWKLARSVDGWGRIHVVERLAEAEDPEIKNWMLREGYRNSVMYDYLAYTCATAGGLLSALSQSEIDRELLTAAGEILEALFDGGPAQDIDDYADGALATEMYLGHVETADTIVADYAHVVAIQEWLQSDSVDWQARSEQQWTPERRHAILAACERLLSRPDCQAKALHALAKGDESSYYSATLVADAIDLDTWDLHWRRLQETPTDVGRWQRVLMRIDQRQIDEVVQFAEQSLDLTGIATGPANELGLGLEWSRHLCLGSLLQGLRDWPGQGRVLIATALQSPVIGNRNGALRVMSAWGKAAWGDELTKTLEAAIPIEPDEQVQKHMQKVLRGESLDD